MKGKNYYYSCVTPEESDAQTERFRALGARDGEIFIDTIGEKSSQRNNLRLLKQQWQRGEISLREAGRRLGVTHQTFKEWVEEPEED